LTLATLGRASRLKIKPAFDGLFHAVPQHQDVQSATDTNTVSKKRAFHSD
jgi:hypothetical protein